MSTNNSDRQRNLNLKVLYCAHTLSINIMRLKNEHIAKIIFRLCGLLFGGITPTLSDSAFLGVAEIDSAYMKIFCS